jgi:uncharacterized membrane protein
MKKLSMLALSVATCVAAASPAAAQAANNNTTIPFVVMTLFTPGTVAVPLDLAVAGAVGTEMERVLRERASIISPITGVAIPIEIARVAIEMMTTATPGARDQMARALTNSGANAAVINQLLSNLPSLLSNPTAGQLQNALSAFNGFVNNSNAAFLVNPPAEFLALHAILLQVSTAANRIPHP